MASRLPGEIRLLVDAADTHVFYLEVVLDPVLRAFAPYSGLLDAAERRDFVGDDAYVDANDAVLERFRDAPDAPDVAAVEIRGQSVLRIIRELDQLLLRLEAKQ